MKRWLLLAPLALMVVVACGLGAGSATPGARPAPPVKSTTADGSAGYAPAKPGLTAAGPDLPPTQGPRVIKAAAITVEVRNGAFDSTVDKLFALGNELGGYISGSAAQTDSGSLRAGTISVMVPVDKFDQAIARVRQLGRVQQLNISGQDVSAQFVDLQARLKNAQAQEAAYNALLQRATSVQDIIAIQNQLGQITQLIEQLEGQIAYLEHATSYSTVSVTVRETASAPAPVDSWGFQTALLDSVHGFVNTLDWIIVGLGNALPVLVILGLLGFGFWRWTRRPGRVARSA